MLRLYLRFYLTLVGSLIFFAIAAATFWHLSGAPAPPMPNRPMHTARNFHVALVLLALSIGVVAYPVVRRMTRRLERLQHGVESLGAGDLSARVAVEGNDEVARLASSFNRSASQIEQLVRSHKTLLANASHELRTPLARIRLAVELLKDSADPKRRAGLESDIAELDWLVDEILLASKLDAVSNVIVTHELDLLALAAEECARYDGAHLEGEPVTIQGDARLLRRLLRNLLENAARHGSPPAQVRVTRDSDATVTIRVWDAGSGVPVSEWDNVFRPFYRSRAQSEPPASSADAAPANPSGRSGGTGLGLSLVQQIARHHGGDARCARLDDGRSCFQVTLPWVATPPLNPVQRLTPERPLTPPPWEVRSKT
jgi:signal transduction histidine kinase